MGFVTTKNKADEVNNNYYSVRKNVTCSSLYICALQWYAHIYIYIYTTNVLRAAYHFSVIYSIIVQTQVDGGAA